MSTAAEPARTFFVRRPGTGRVLLVSLSLLSVVFLAVLVGWPSALALMGVLLLHEVGHAVAMRSVGVRSVRILLLPWGGATIGKTSLQLDPQALILLGGAGGSALVGTLALALAALTGGAFAAEIGVLVLLLAAVNLLNLLPFPPLDGGRLLLRLADGLGPKVGLILRIQILLGALVLVLASGGHFLAWVALVFAVLGLGFFGAVRLALRDAGEPPEPSAAHEAEHTGFWAAIYAGVILTLVALAGGAWSLAGVPSAFARSFTF